MRVHSSIIERLDGRKYLELFNNTMVVICDHLGVEAIEKQLTWKSSLCSRPISHVTPLSFIGIQPAYIGLTKCSPDTRCLQVSSCNWRWVCVT